MLCLIYCILCDIEQGKICGEQQLIFKALQSSSCFRLHVVFYYHNLIS